MALLGGTLGYRLLRRFKPAAEDDHAPRETRSKLAHLFGHSIWDEIRDKVVIDFGCGTGTEAVEMATRGAARVLGIDIRHDVLSEARDRAMRAGVSDRCTFTTSTDERADLIFSLDAFEHFQDPAAILGVMRGLVTAQGYARVVFGPTWYHPLGGHLFSVFPWAHLIFAETALIRWRSDFKTDGATRFSEVAGGLNQMTIRRFEKIVASSDWEFESLEKVPIRRLRRFSNRLTQEFFTSVVRCRLNPRRLP